MRVHVPSILRDAFPDPPAMTFSFFPRFLMCAGMLIPLPGMAVAPAYECAGKTQFIHRGAPSTVPADARRSYRFDSAQFEGMPCTISDDEIGCHGLTPEQAYRRLLIDRTNGSVKDTLELPTSMLIFEGQCK